MLVVIAVDAWSGTKIYMDINIKYTKRGQLYLLYNIITNTKWFVYKFVSLQRSTIDL